MSCQGTTEDGKQCTCEMFYPPAVPGIRQLCQECEHGRSKHSNPPEQLRPTYDSQYCWGKGEGGEDCDCEAYFPPEPGQRQLCQECLHGISKHPKATHVPLTASNNTVLGIFKKVVSNNPEARDEMSTGFRPGMASASKGKKTKDRASKTKPKLIKVGKAVAILCGVDREKLQLHHIKVPLRTEEAVLEQRGCAKIGSNNLQINKEWTAENVEVFLRGCFPCLFDYMDNTRAYQKCTQRWFLLDKQKGRLTIVPTHPITGQDLKRFRGRDGVPIAESAIYIASRYAVPDDEFQSWDLKKISGDVEMNEGMLVDEPEHDFTVKMEDDAHIEISSDESDGKPDVKRPKLRPGAAAADTKSLLRPVVSAKTVVKRKRNAGSDRSQAQTREPSPLFLPESPIVMNSKPLLLARARGPVVPEDTRRVSDPCPFIEQPIDYDALEEPSPRFNPWEHRYSIPLNLRL